MKVFLALAAVALLATVVLPAASAHPYCIPDEPDCEVVELRDCPPGTNGPHVYVLGDELTKCWY